MEHALDDPLRAAKAVSRLVKSARGYGIKVEAGHDFGVLADIVRSERGQDPSFFFDPSYSELGPANGLWLVGRHKGKVVHTQAFRSVLVGEGFRQFLINWASGLAMRASEPFTLARFEERDTAYTRGLRGRLVYHGEMWIRPGKGKLMDGPVDVLGRLGLLSAHLKWQPEAVFALVSPRSIRRGMVTRYGYPYIEKDFATYASVPGSIPPEEGLAIAKRADIEDLVRVVVDQKKKTGR